MPVCPICTSSSFAPFASFDIGSWEQKGGEAHRVNRLFEYGCCRTCQHVMIVSPYDEQIFQQIYSHQEPVFWSDREDNRANIYEDMLEFCVPSLVDDRAGVYVDFGCGHGDLLKLLRDRYAKPTDRLVGVDFLRHLPPEFPFAGSDLNRLDENDVAGWPGEIAFAFATHLMEHLLDPRKFLCELRRRMVDGGRLYIEVPDNEKIYPEELGFTNGLFNAQHIQYYTRASLTALAQSCGFVVEKTETQHAGYIPRLKMLLRASDARGPRELIRFAFDFLQQDRARVAGRILELADQDPVGLWGLGADFSRMLDEVPAFAARVRSGTLALFDLGLAGQRVAGIEVRNPAGIASFEGTVVLMPMPGDVRMKMKRYAGQAGFAEGRVLDLYQQR